MSADCHQALVLVFFGTTKDEGLQVYDHIEAFMGQRHPAMQVCRAFTSQMVIRRLHDRGIAVPNLAETLNLLKQQGIKKVAVVPFLIVPGQEYGKIRSVLAAEQELEWVCAAPLLHSDDDIQAVIEALDQEIPPGIPTVIACHGNEQHDQFNHEIRVFAQRIEASYPQVMVATIEGDAPGQAPLLKAHQMALQTQAVHFIPLMLVAGDHVMNDIMGDEPDSWKAQVAAETTTCSKPAGMNDRILELYCQHLDAAYSGGSL